MLPIMAKLNIILRSECVNTWGFLHSLGERVKGDDDSAIDPNRAGLFEGSFSWGRGGGQIDPPFIFQEELI